MLNHLYMFFVVRLISSSSVDCLEKQLDSDKLIVLDKTNFHSAIAENDFILVNFYAPGCGACEGLAPEYDKAAEIMSEENKHIKIAKIDAIKEKEIAEEHGIDGYPTVRYFRKGLTSLDYKGMRTAEDIVSWAIKRSGPPAVELKTVKEAKDLIKKNDVVTIGFFKDASDETVKTYLAAAELSEYSVFAITFEKNIFKHFNTKPESIILFNKEYKNEAVFNKEFTKNEILKFVELRSLPLIMEMTKENSLHLFSKYIKLHLLLIMPKSDPDTKQRLKSIESVAADFKENILFTFFDADKSEYTGILKYFGITETGVVRLINFDKGLKRYKPTNPEISVDNIRNFLENFFDGKLQRTLKSGELPEDWNKGPIYELVGDNFESVVMDRTKDVLVEFYAPWCNACKQFASVYDQIGEHYETRNDLIIAKVDASNNEFENKVIQSLPTITLYTKTKKIIDYHGQLTFEDIVKFIESGGTIQEQNQEDLATEKKSKDTEHKKDTSKNDAVKQEL